MISNRAEELIRSIEELKKTHVRTLVERRVSEFKELGEGESREIFKELCFCILCANYSAERSIKIQKQINDGFLTLSKQQLVEKLKELGHRFPKTRAEYIVSARKYSDSIKRIIKESENSKELRNWLVENIHGIGMKEASHFLRNIGYTDLAILDFHILDLLTKYRIIEKPKRLTKSIYLQIEKELRRIAELADLNMAELDLYLWYMETGKVLK